MIIGVSGNARAGKDTFCNLYKENKEDYTYPVDGWYWFESLEEAQNFFGIEPEEESEIII